jgi:thiol-disulfide isomerase/thioredoxin
VCSSLSRGPGPGRRRVLALAAAAALLLGADAPLSLLSLDGEPVELRPGDEAALLVHFWATWCPSCVEELPLLAAAVARCPEERVRILMVDVDESAETVRAWLAERDLALPVLRDPKGAVWRRLGGGGLPLNATWSGGRRRVEVGPRDAAAWRAALQQLGCPAP